MFEDGMSNDVIYSLILYMFSIVVIFAVAVFFATWAVMKYVLHKKYPKLVGFLVVIGTGLVLWGISYV